MDNRKQSVSVPFYENLVAAKQAYDQELLARDRAQSEANFLTYRKISQELAADPRFVTTFN